MADQPNKEIFNTSPDTPKDLVAELVGEGKKYKTTEELARGRIEADVHIARLETEAKALREQAAAAKSIEDVLEAIKANASTEQTPPSTEKPLVATPGFSQAEIAKMVAEQVVGLDSKKAREANRIRANAKMVELFGEKAQEMYLKEAATPELQAIYKELAEVNPEKFVSMFVKETPQKNIDHSSLNSAALNLNQNVGTAAPGTQAFYSKLRKENPKLYLTAATQVQMHKDALADPDKYFGRK